MKLGTFASHARLAGATAAIFAFFSGCSMLETGGDKLAQLPGDSATAEGAAPQPGASITLEIRPSGQEPEITRMPLTGLSTVQQTLDQTRLSKRFRRMNIQVLRVAGDRRAKMDVKYDRSKGNVNPLYDYALHPGDHLIVIEDTTTAFDDMLNSLAGPARNAIGR